MLRSRFWILPILLATVLSRCRSVGSLPLAPSPTDVLIRRAQNHANHTCGRFHAQYLSMVSGGHYTAEDGTLHLSFWVATDGVTPLAAAPHTFGVAVWGSDGHLQVEDTLSTVLSPPVASLSLPGVKLPAEVAVVHEHPCPTLNATLTVLPA